MNGLCLQCRRQKILKRSKKTKHRSKKDKSYRGNPNWAGDD